MSDRIHVKIALDLFVEDVGAMRQATFERLRSAWSSNEDFPYESAKDVPLDQAVHSLLANALPADLPGCRRSQLEVEAESADDPQETSPGDSDDDSPPDPDETDDSQDSTSDPDEGDDSQDSTSDQDEPPNETTSDDDNDDRRRNE